MIRQGWENQFCERWDDWVRWDRWVLIDRYLSEREEHHNMLMALGYTVENIRITTFIIIILANSYRMLPKFQSILIFSLILQWEKLSVRKWGNLPSFDIVYKVMKQIFKIYNTYRYIICISFASYFSSGKKRQLFWSHQGKGYNFLQIVYNIHWFSSAVCRLLKEDQGLFSSSVQ